MTFTMEPVEKDSIELQELKSEFNDLKAMLSEQRIVNKSLLEHIRKQKTSFIAKDLTKRMFMDIMTIPMISVICINVGWPMPMAAAVSLWALIDLFAVLEAKRRFDAQKMLDDDVLTVAKSVRAYKRFYHLSMVIGAIPAVLLIAFVLIHIYTQTAASDRQLPAAFYILLGFTSLVYVWLAFRMYRKKMDTCDSLIDSLENR